MAEHTAEDLSERLFTHAIATMESASVWLGARLGWYADLHRHRASTAAELADRTGTQERYAREWLEQQAVMGVLTMDGDGRFALPAGHAEALLDTDSPTFVEPFVRAVMTATLQLPALADVYRRGGGVPWHAYGPDMSRAQGDSNRPLLLHALPRDWVPQVPELSGRLEAGARVADIGCGHGWSAIGLAREFPAVRVDGYDVDAAALAEASMHADEFGVADRVSFVDHDVSGGLPAGDYDVLLAVECVHDMPYPVQILAAMRAAARDDAIMLVVDEAADAELTAPGDEIQRLLYGFSLLICLPDSASHPDSVATGTVMRPSVLDGYAKAAGFAGAEPLELSDTGFFRFYRLDHGGER